MVFWTFINMRLIVYFIYVGFAYIKFTYIEHVIIFDLHIVSKYIFCNQAKGVETKERACINTERLPTQMEN